MERHLQRASSPSNRCFPTTAAFTAASAALRSAKVQQAIEAAPWRTEGNAHVPSVWSAVQTPVQGPAALAVGQPQDDKRAAPEAVSAASSQHYASASVSALVPTRVASPPPCPSGATATAFALVSTIVPPILLALRLHHLGRQLKLPFLVLVLFQILHMGSYFVAIVPTQGKLNVTSANYLT